ncbi:collagen alpha-1(I) chain-like [Manis pentadactyla]|uniref:collagen alpha-1(I) chain-like n=1 Tax=Manis pentadactyla TaxID=143292 RepID=UPI00255CC6E9|nr:collagen alpha-1(I) chain-like [Manis pentadactyla]
MPAWRWVQCHWGRPGDCCPGVGCPLGSQKLSQPQGRRVEGRVALHVSSPSAQAHRSRRHCHTLLEPSPPLLPGTGNHPSTRNCPSPNSGGRSPRAPGQRSARRAHSPRLETRGSSRLCGERGRGVKGGPLFRALPAAKLASPPPPPSFSPCAPSSPSSSFCSLSLQSVETVWHSGAPPAGAGAGSAGGGLRVGAASGTPSPGRSVRRGGRPSRERGPPGRGGRRGGRGPPLPPPSARPPGPAFPPRRAPTRARRLRAEFGAPGSRGPPRARRRLRGDRMAAPEGLCGHSPAVFAPTSPLPTSRPGQGTAARVRWDQPQGGGGGRAPRGRVGPLKSLGPEYRSGKGPAPLLATGHSHRRPLRARDSRRKEAQLGLGVSYSSCHRASHSCRSGTGELWRPSFLRDASDAGQPHQTSWFKSCTATH